MSKTAIVKRYDDSCMMDFYSRTDLIEKSSYEEFGMVPEGLMDEYEAVCKRKNEIEEVFNTAIRKLKLIDPK